MGSELEESERYLSALLLWFSPLKVDFDFTLLFKSEKFLQFFLYIFLCLATLFKLDVEAVS